MGNKFFRFSLDEELLKRVKSMAALKGTTIKQIITWLLLRELERFEKDITK